MTTLIDSPDGRIPCLRVEFVPLADRYAHVIQLVRADGPRTILRSIEGGPSDAWPPSPALQQLHSQADGPRGTIALLVGMAGTSHWSLSVARAETELSEPMSGLTGGLEFDVACRARNGDPPWLGSRYRCEHETLPTAFPGRIELVAGAGWSVELRGVPEFPVLPRLRDDVIDCSPLVQPKPGTTWRWKYRVELRETRDRIGRP